MSQPCLLLKLVLLVYIYLIANLTGVQESVICIWEGGRPVKV